MSFDTNGVNLDPDFNKLRCPKCSMVHDLTGVVRFRTYDTLVMGKLVEVTQELSAYRCERCGYPIPIPPSH